jgi:chorismate mutase/prephenate dehydratase
VAKKAGPDMANYTRVLYSMLFELSRSYQSKRNNSLTALYQKITDSIENTPKLFPQAPMVACQGVEGAYAQIACERIFKNPFIMYFKNFDAVFNAIEQGLCQYGILPIENSTAGSVKKVYDLMISRNFKIVKTVRIKIDHNLLVKKGTRKEDIKEIFSHEQAINQCASYLAANFPDAKITRVENTALAAKAVAESGRDDVASLSSRSAASQYGLCVLAAAVQDNGNNHTRFICITNKLEVYPGADRTTLMIVTPPKPGALYRILSRFNALGINLLKLESRPIPDRDFEFMFYFDLEAPVYSDSFAQLLAELERECDEFTYLGSYSEVI